MLLPVDDNDDEVDGEGRSIFKLRLDSPLLPVVVVEFVNLAPSESLEELEGGTYSRNLRRYS